MHGCSAVGTCFVLFEASSQLTSACWVAGSGYLTACMALLVGASGSVLGVEKHPLLAQQSVKNIHLACPHLEVNRPGAVIQLTHDNIYRGSTLAPACTCASMASCWGRSWCSPGPHCWKQARA
jgi:hypothetical protein